MMSFVVYCVFCMALQSPCTIANILSYYIVFCIFHAGVGNSEKLTSFSVAPSYLHHSNNMMVQNVDMTPLALLVHSHPDTRTTSTMRSENPMTQCWSQQGISLTWSQNQSDERFLFSQPWDVSAHYYLN